MSTVKERYHPIVMGVNATVQTTNEMIGGFLCLTSGTITVTRTGDGVVVVNAVPVFAGNYTPIPFYVGINGAAVTLAGGASGTLGV